MTKILLIVLILVISSTTYSQPQLTTYAAEDYRAYQKSRHTNPRWDPFVKEGFEALDQQNLQTTIEFLRKTVALGCRSPLVYFKLALAYEGLGSYYSAIQYYEMARDAFKKAHKSHRYKKHFDENYGRALYMMGQSDKALPILEKAAKHSKSYWLLKLLGQITLSKGDYLTTTAYYERALKLKSPEVTTAERIGLNLELARLYLKQNQFEGARRYYERVIQIDPNNSEASEFLREIQRRETQEKVFEIFEEH